jgi:hypothetical protein
MGALLQNGSETWATVALRQRRVESWADRGVPEEDATPPRAAPRESGLPWDVRILRPAGVSRPVEGGWGWRGCLRKGCGRRFQARRYNQRYCQDPECLREVRRWQGAKRQRKCRSQAEGRQRHVEAERERRKQRACQPPKPPESESTPAEPCAWSRSRKFPKVFCDRPGCYEPPRDSPRALASYCGDDCRGAMRQAQDRERKWLRRKTEAGRFKRRLEYQATRAKRREGPVASGDMGPGQSSARSGAKGGAVLGYQRGGDRALDLSAPTEVISHDPKTTPGSRPRAPPAS